jgi:hypothetical protein
VALDAVTRMDLSSRAALLFDDLVSWDQRDADERYVAELLAAISAHPAVAKIEHTSHRLIDFVQARLRQEIVWLLRGWRLAQAAPAAGELIYERTAPPALALGVQAGLGLDLAYAAPTEQAGFTVERAVLRHAMRGLAAISRSQHVRVAAVISDQLALAFAAVSRKDLRVCGAGILPLSGLDHGRGALLAARHRIPLLPGYGSPQPGPSLAMALPERLELASESALDQAVTLLVASLLVSAAPGLHHAVTALKGLLQTPSLKSVLIPSAESGPARLLIEWAHARELRVAVMQQDMYRWRQSDETVAGADLVLGWGAATEEQTRGWDGPHPEVFPIGVSVRAPAPARNDSPPTVVRRVLIVLGAALASRSILPVSLSDLFIETLMPGLDRLVRAGVELELVRSPHEDPEHYRRLFQAQRVDVRIRTDCSVAQAIAGNDLVVASVCSGVFEPAALGLPMLLWLGPLPEKLRTRYLTTPWVQAGGGMFECSEQFSELALDLVKRPGATISVARELGERLSGYSQPFDRACFTQALHELAA